MPGHVSSSSLLDFIGAGEPLDWCAKVHVVGACSDRHKNSETVVRHWCKRKSCPTCYPIWAGRVGGRAKERLLAYAEISDRMRGSKQRNLSGERVFGAPGFIHPGAIKHFVFSPPQEWAIRKLGSLPGIRSLRRELYHVLDVAGIRAGVVIFHPWRATDRARDEFHTAKDNGERYANHGLWHWLIRSGRVRSEDYVYLSPHFHVVGLGFAMRSNDFHQATARRDREGWIYKNIRTLRTEKEISNVLFYLLGHTSIIQDPKTGRGMESITYFGEISKVSMGRELQSSADHDVSCPDCGEPVFEWVGWDQEFGPVGSDQESSWSWTWNDKDHHVQPNPTYEIMQYRIEKHRYFLKSHPKYFSIQIRGREPIRDRGPPREMVVDKHDGHAYDWVSGQWMDENGTLDESPGLFSERGRGGDING